MGLEEVKQTFLIESRELLEAMEHALLDLEQDFHDEESLNAMFRAAHTIKGSGGMFGYSNIVEFTHVVENFLDKVRKGDIELNTELTSHLLRCHDHISSLVELYVEDDTPDIPQNLKEEGDELMAFLGQHLLDQHSDEDKPSDSNAEKSNASGEQEDGSVGVENSHWHISLRIKEDVFRHGLDPLSFINYLNGIGTVVNLLTIVDNVPDLEEIYSESCYLGFEIEYDSDKDKETIEQVFEFLMDDCLLTILPPNAKITLYEKMFWSLPESPERLNEIFTEMKILTQEELAQISVQGEVVDPVKKEESETQEVTEMDGQKKPVVTEVQQNSDSLPVKDKKKVEKSQDSGKFQSVVQRYIRIDANKLDTLINQVGELVITSANVRQLSEQSGNKDLTEASSIMNRLVEDIRDISMNIRMVQIGETFRKFERVVHDLSRDMGKKINLRILGGETELDKTVVEKISDPLIHLIRNAVDHGIASPEERKKAGKPETGVITLNAHHDTGNIVIEVSDDGEGLSAEKIFAKAVEVGIANEGQNLTEKEIFSFVFNAGFSTAKEITNISGRGVGMDVVRRNVESLRGSIDIDSEKGKGTTIRIYLPLTLAIIDGFLARVGKSSYVLPLDMVLECIDLSDEYRISRESGNFINLRGEVLPFLNLRDFFNMKDVGDENIEENQSIIVVNYARQKAGLVVDELFGEFQTVIKPLGKIFRNLQGISGATILGNGEVALILDVPRLITSASKIKRKEKVEQFDLKED